jgi:hypothetical protein
MQCNDNCLPIRNPPKIGAVGGMAPLEDRDDHRTACASALHYQLEIRAVGQPASAAES